LCTHVGSEGLLNFVVFLFNWWFFVCFFCFFIYCFNYIFDLLNMKTLFCGMIYTSVMTIIINQCLIVHYYFYDDHSLLFVNGLKFIPCKFTCSLKIWCTMIFVHMPLVSEFWYYATHYFELLLNLYKYVLWITIAILKLKVS